MKLGLKNQKGFTLVELAIVLVIIGIILGAVLKGQELINNAKIKRAYNQYREIFAAVYTYYDKFGKFPGDDNTSHPTWAGFQAGNNDGNIGGGFEYACSGAEVALQESCNLWSHLRWANIITGAGGSRTNPGNAYGGAIAVAYGTINTISANWIAMQNIPRDAAHSIDTQYDDGVWNTGSIQGSANFTTIGAPIVVYYRF